MQIAPGQSPHDVAGIRVPMVEAPLGTYTGWNMRARGHGAGALHSFSGSYIPLPESRDEREATGDPRAVRFAWSCRFGGLWPYPLHRTRIWRSGRVSDLSVVSGEETVR